VDECFGSAATRFTIWGVILFSIAVFGQSVIINMRMVNTRDRLPSKIGTIAVEELDLLDEENFIVDTRGAANFKLSHLPGAINLELSDIRLCNQKAIESFTASAGKNVFVYCQSDVCGTSLSVAEYLQYWPVQSVRLIQGDLLPLLSSPLHLDK
jgi:rhodanese-related sulfurtransferase